MRKLILLLGGLIFSFHAFSQDILTKKNGDEIKVRVLEVTNTEIKYKKWSNQDGPSYTLPKDDVFMIKYKNGEKDVFNDSNHSNFNKQSPESENNNEPIKALPASDNDYLIAQYNTMDHKFIDVKQKDKEAKGWHGTIGVSSNSVLSSADIKVQIKSEKKSYPYYTKSYDGKIVSDYYNLNKYGLFQGKYVIELFNKTSKTIYIDKANCFRIDKDGGYKSYFNNQQTTINQGSGSGASLNLGALTGTLGIEGLAGKLASGTNIGGGNQTSSSTTYVDQRIIAIPPQGKILLSKDEAVLINESTLSLDKFKLISLSEDFHDEKINGLKIGEYRTFNQENSPLNKKYILTYSLNPNFDKIYRLEFQIYLKDAIGYKYNSFGNRGCYRSFPEKKLSNFGLNTICVGGNN